MDFRKKYFFMVIILLIVLFLLFIPIIPTSVELIDAQIVDFKYERTSANIPLIPSNAPDINVKNMENISGTFSVVMVWAPNSGGSKKIGNTHSEFQFIEPNSTYTFKVPEEWKFIGPDYSFEVNVFAPTKIENVSTTQTEYKSVISIIINN